MWLTKIKFQVNPRLHGKGISPEDWRSMMREIETAVETLQNIPRKYLRQEA